MKGMTRCTKKDSFSVKIARERFVLQKFSYLPISKKDKGKILGEDAIVNDAVNKLSALEDIEEELGLPLVAYHKLMDCLYCGDKSKIFCKTEDGIIEVGILEIDYCKKKVIFYKDKNYNDDFVYGLYSYGETWSFSKEELE